MIFQILALLSGILAGIFTGLVPGIHINLIAATILSLSLQSKFQTTTILIFITAMAITHTFLDFIPSIFLGAPSEETALSVLPGHHFLLQGKANQAIKLTTIGSTIAIILTLILLPIFLKILTPLQNFITKMT